MKRRILTPIAMLSFLLVLPAGAGEIGAPDPDPGGDRSVLTRAGGGLLGASLGAGLGLLVGSTIADGDSDAWDFDELAGAVAGAAIVEPFALALGVHAAGGEDSSYGRTLLGSLGATAVVYGATALTDEGSVLAALIPLQLAGAIWAQGTGDAPAPEPRTAVRLSPWVDEERQGFVLSGTF